MPHTTKLFAHEVMTEDRIRDVTSGLTNCYKSAFWIYHPAAIEND